MRVFTWARASGGAAVSNTDGRGFDTFRACSYAPDFQSKVGSPDASILTTAEHRRRGHFPMAPHGSVAPWGAAGGNPAVSRTQGFDSSPTHEQQCASRLTGRVPGSYPGEDWVRGPGRARIHAAVAQPVRATACRAEGHGFESRRWRASRRSPMERAPAYEAGGCRFDPCRRHHLVVAQRREHRPPKAGVARSNRAGEAEPTRLQVQHTEGIRPDQEPGC